MDQKLIKANIALYNGSRSDARRLIDEYRAENPRPEPEMMPTLLWLDALAQDDRTTRSEKLALLVEKGGKNNRYVEIAREQLAWEQKYADKNAPAEDVPVLPEGDAPPKRSLPKVWGVDLKKVAVFAVIGILIGAVLWAMLGSRPAGTGETVNQIATNAVLSPTTAPTLAPDRSVRIDPVQHEAEYDDGRLQISAYEDGSQRVGDLRGNPQSPVAGTRFFAMHLIFECQNGGTCSQPPEVNLFALTDTGATIPPVADVGIIGEDLMQPVGSGSNTNGWVIFQVPQASQVNALVVAQPAPPGQDAPAPIVISLISESEEVPPNIPVETTPDVNP